MKLLMVTCRNIDKSGGENALIMGRHISLYKEYSIKTDIVFSHKNTEVYDESTCPGIHFIECVKDNLYHKLDELLDKKEYQGVVVSGFNDKRFTKYIKEKRSINPFIYIVDIHSTIKEVYEYCIPDLYHILGTRYLYIKKKLRFIETLEAVDYAFVVSNEEIVEVNRILPKNDIKFIKICCGCYAPLDLNNYFIFREKQRELMGFDKRTLAFVYSGSTDRWQKYKETVELYKKVQETGVKSKFAFYMKLDDSEKNSLYSELGVDNVSVRWVTPEIMKQELTAYDVGVMIRDRNWTNRVAFPNKFSDYISSGLIIGLSEAVVDPYKITQKYGIDLFDLSDVNNNVIKFSESRHNDLERYVKICHKIVEEELLYSKQVKRNCFELNEALNNNLMRLK